jgi:hypothetical protein
MEVLPDFLRDYIPEVLGIDWCKAEQLSLRRSAIRLSPGARKPRNT